MNPTFHYRLRTREDNAPIHAILLEMGDAHIIMLLGLLCQGANAPIEQVVGPKAKLESLHYALQTREQLFGMFRQLAEEVRLSHPQSTTNA